MMNELERACLLSVQAVLSVARQTIAHSRRESETDYEIGWNDAIAYSNNLLVEILEEIGSKLEDSNT